MNLSKTKRIRAHITGPTYKSHIIQIDGSYLWRYSATQFDSLIKLQWLLSTQRYMKKLFLRNYHHPKLKENQPAHITPGNISRLVFRLLPTKEVARPLLPIRPVLSGRGPASPKPINHTTMAVLAVNELVAFVAHGTKKRAQ